MRSNHEQAIMYDLQTKISDDVAHAISRVASLAIDDEMKLPLTLQAAPTGVSALAFMIEHQGGKTDNRPAQLATLLIAALMCAHSLTQVEGIDLRELITIAKNEVIDMARAGVVGKGPLS